MRLLRVGHCGWWRFFLGGLAGVLSRAALDSGLRRNDGCRGRDDGRKLGYTIGNAAATLARLCYNLRRSATGIGRRRRRVSLLRVLSGGVGHSRYGLPGTGGSGDGHPGCGRSRQRASSGGVGDPGCGHSWQRASWLRVFPASGIPGTGVVRRRRASSLGCSRNGHLC